MNPAKSRARRTERAREGALKHMKRFVAMMKVEITAFTGLDLNY